MPQITLTPDQQATLLQAQRMLHDLLSDIDALQQCNDPACDALRAQNQSIRDEITRLQTNFGPNRGLTSSS